MGAASRLVWSVLLLVGCGGAPFEPSSLTGSPLAGAQSSAGAQSAGESSGLSGGAAGAAGGSTSEIPEAPGGAGGAELGAAGVDSGGAPTIHLPCETQSWTASAFASRDSQPASLMLDGDATSLWTSGTAREAGQWIALELGAGVVLERLELRAAATPADLPIFVGLELDGEPVDAVETSPERGLLVLTFAAQAASSARLVLTSSAPLWWSVAEITGGCQ
jgi:hypothetical protein